jgi:hemoglobin
MPRATNLTRKWISLLLLIVVTLGSFSQDAEARRRRRRTRTKRAPIINEKKLYERIGGPKRMGEIVDEWMRLNLADARVAPAFVVFTTKPALLARERRNLGDQLCELADGPCTVRESLKKGDDGETLHLDEAQFLVFGDNLFRSMQKYSVPEREKNELLGRLGETKADFVASAAGKTASK